MYTMIIIGACTASAAMAWAAGYISKCKREYNEAIEEDNKDICREATFETWLTATDFKEEASGRFYY